MNAHKWKRFRSIWMPVRRLLDKQQADGIRHIGTAVWSEAKRRYDLVATEAGTAADSETITQLTAQVTSVSIEESGTKPPSASLARVDVTERNVVSKQDQATVVDQQQAALSCVEMSGHALKWFAAADNKYKALFQKKNDDF